MSSLRTVSEFRLTDVYTAAERQYTRSLEKLGFGLTQEKVTVRELSLVYFVVQLSKSIDSVGMPCGNKEYAVDDLSFNSTGGRPMTFCMPRGEKEVGNSEDIEERLSGCGDGC